MILPDNFFSPKPNYIKSIELDDYRWEFFVTKLKSIMLEYEPNFDLTEELSQIYRDLLLYFLGSNQSKYDLSKGLYIYGDPGCGKSLMLQYVFKRFTSYIGVNSYRIAQSVDICRDMQNNGLLSVSNYVLSHNNKPYVLYVDDFGAGNLKINYFGTPVDVFSELIVNRYPYFVRDGTLTHFSSNVKPSDFITVFDDRIASRMAEMVNMVYVPKYDYRRKN